MPSTNNYDAWTGEELRRGESAANRFLVENTREIFAMFASQCEALEHVVNLLRVHNLTLEQRVDRFARIAELCNSIGQNAEGFFSLASEPVVARLIASAR